MSNETLDWCLIKTITGSKVMLGKLKNILDISERARYLREKLSDVLRQEDLIDNGYISYELLEKVTIGITGRTGVKFDISMYGK